MFGRAYYYNNNSIKNKNFDIKSIFHLPNKITLALLTIIFTSILCLYSSKGGNLYPWAIKQIFFACFSLSIFALIASVNIKLIYKYAYHILFISIILLILVIPLGRRTLGAARWIDFGFLKFQPSELAKIAVIISLSKYFSSIKIKNIYSLTGNICAILLVFPIICLVVIQPDLATTIIITCLVFIMMFAIGVAKSKFIYLAVTGIFCAPIIWLKFLKDYQKLRIINFLFPENDPLGSGYNVIQSKIAIGSGGLFGKGFLKGTQGQLNFLPEHHTDFIFTIIGEEFGFIGALVIIGLYLYIVFYGLNLTKKISSSFARLLCIGSSSLIFLHMFVNIGMTISLMPVAGIPLIMLSYGGSHLIIGTICVAIIANIDIHKKSL